MKDKVKIMQTYNRLSEGHITQLPSPIYKIRAKQNFQAVRSGHVEICAPQIRNHAMASKGNNVNASSL